MEVDKLQALISLWLFVVFQHLGHEKLSIVRQKNDFQNFFDFSTFFADMHGI